MPWSSRLASTARLARSRLTPSSNREELRVLRLRGHLRRLVHRLHHGRASSARNGAVRGRQGGLDPGAPPRSGLSVGGLRLLASAPDPHVLEERHDALVTLTVLNPATEELIAELEQAGVEEADEAVARAKAEFPGC